VRIVAGSRKGHRIQAPKGVVTRPTSDRVREAVFSILGSVEGAQVLDLFAGSGAMGLEALSRGAAGCVFVESDRQAARVIQANLEKLRLTGAVVITRDAVILVGAAILHYFIGNKMKVKPSWTGKVATVCQMCAIAWVMLQLRFLPLWFVVTIAGIFTAVSGVIYVIEGVRQLQAEGHAHATR